MDQSDYDKLFILFAEKLKQTQEADAIVIKQLQGIYRLYLRKVSSTNFDLLLNCRPNFCLCSQKIFSFMNNCVDIRKKC